MGLLRNYWKEYGGSRALIRSMYLWVAIVGTAVGFRYWVDSAWWDLVISVVPSMLGFSLGGYAIFLGFGDRGFQRFAAEEDNGRSTYMEASATFYHFILVQVSALGVAILAKTLPIRYVDADDLPEAFWRVQQVFASVGSGIGFGLFAYAIMTALAASGAIFKLSRAYHQWLLSLDSE